MAGNVKSYAEYLHLPQLLSLQNGFEVNETAVSEDELHFIVVHQVFELWFKQVIREVRMARDRMAARFVPEKDIPYVVRHLRRVNAIMRMAVNNFDVLETLTPLDFIAFRKKLEPASGAQSFQMRQIEYLLGLEMSERSRQGHTTDPADEIIRLAQGSTHGTFVVEAIEQSRQELKEGRTLKAALHDWLYRTPIQGSTPTNANDAEVVLAFLDQYRDALDRYDKRLIPDFDDFISAIEGRELSRARRIRAALLFIESYREAGLLTWPNLLLDSVVELEEQLILWRFRHVRMVERTIGRRLGTGGSPGVAYLDKTTAYRIFNEFWAVRSVLIPTEHLPPLSEPATYNRLETEPPS